MQKSTLPRLSDRTAWPDDALRQLLERIDAELESRTGQNADESASEDLETLEQRLLREARRFQKDSHILRG